MDASLESIVELMRSEIADFDFSLSNLSAFLPEGPFLWIVALLTAFYVLCVRDAARSDRDHDLVHPVARRQESTGTKASPPRSWTEAMM